MTFAVKDYFSQAYFFYVYVCVVNQCYNFDEEENEGTYEDTAFEAAGCYEDDLTKYDQRHTRLSKLLTDNTDTLDDMQSIDNGILVDYEHLASMAKTHGDKTESDHNNNTASKSAGISRKISSQSISRLEYGAGGANAVSTSTTLRYYFIQQK